MTAQASIAATPVEAVVIGSGPNGLAAAISLAREGRSVTVLEGAATIGGGLRTAELTLPGFHHDVCSTIHPFGRTSPFFVELDLARHGLRWVEPPAALGHPFDDGTAVIVRRDVERTAAGLGGDRDAYLRLMAPLVRDWDGLMPDILGPFHVPLDPRRSIRLARFGLDAIRSATAVARRFRGEAARGLFAGAAAHSILRLTEPISAAAALVMLASAHADGWPWPEGGAGRLAAALEPELVALGGGIVVDRPVRSLEDLPPHEVAVFDTAPRNLAAIAGDALPAGYRRSLERYRHGAGVFKLDIAIEGAIPWRADELAETGTVHLGGTLEEIARAEGLVAKGGLPERPFVLLAQTSLFDRTRAPGGRNTVWAYCHVPSGSTADMTEPIVEQIERFAPGFRERVLDLRATSPAEIEAANPNDVGGDIAGGRMDLGQLFTRPTWRFANPYATPNPSIFLCSAATPPGGGVHGMCGLHAARAAARRLR
ncbi:MAG TPA: NAD(P)/FAD-dependent oxidoreductase [Candidatus Limnocylindrales bacterium]|nr:NAD(P)/FAD-dependent oxidoreductase [Candidatus Limnocylindrales bacterium]